MDDMPSFDDVDVVVVGCGLSGAVIAERCASLGKRCLILEKRSHVGGNCYDFVDGETGVRMNLYGAHLFHTSDQGVWDYVNRFSEWVRWEHRVLALVKGQFVPMPVNITTVNMLLGTHIATEAEMRAWLAEHQADFPHPANSEEVARARIGDALFEALVRDYTRKQWGREAASLDASVLARIPVRESFDVRYFSDKFQALPKHGYTALFERILRRPGIRVQTNTDFFDHKARFEALPPANRPLLVYTGPVDRFFPDAGLGPLEYRSIEFHVERHATPGFVQPNSVVNHPGADVRFTRSVEYKHFLNQTAPGSVVVRETSVDGGEPFYPVPTPHNRALYEQYARLAQKETATGTTIFVGRLANYKYFNMDQAIRNALDTFSSIVEPAVRKRASEDAE